jgi:hypothetical protein
MSALKEVLKKADDALKAGKKASGAMDMASVRQSLPDQIVPKKRATALRMAQLNASMPVEKGGLGLRPDNTPEERAMAMGFKDDVYHGTKQDITGSFKPVYDDGLSFTTPYPEFANNWIGKGKYQLRRGEIGESEQKEINRQYQDIRDQEMNWKKLEELRVANSDDQFHSEYDKMHEAFKTRYQREVGLPTDKIHSTVYPMKYRAEKLFDPEKDFAVMDEYADNLYRDDKVQRDAMKKLYQTGHYMMYETKPVIDFLKSKGYDAIRLKEDMDGAYTTIAPFSPNQLRSRFANFDPMLKDSDSLLAGVALPVIAMPKEDKRTKDKKVKK